MDTKLGGPHSRSGRGGEEKKSQPPPGIEPYNPDSPAHSLTLYRLSYHINISRIYMNIHELKSRQQ
jgi:hypothetical protein